MLVCVAILVPFFTAAVYSLQRYRLNLPYLRGFIGVQNYLDFASDPAFWNTLGISLRQVERTYDGLLAELRRAGGRANGTGSTRSAATAPRTRRAA